MEKLIHSHKFVSPMFQFLNQIIQTVIQLVGTLKIRPNMHEQ
jgi:hypothetical protein